MTWDQVRTTYRYVHQISRVEDEEGTDKRRYPDLYAYRISLISWANLYARVVQTAQDFVRRFLGSTTSTLGTVVAVNPIGSRKALFDSLSRATCAQASSMEMVGLKVRMLPRTRIEYADRVTV